MRKKKWRREENEDKVKRVSDEKKDLQNTHTHTNKSRWRREGGNKSRVKEGRQEEN